MPLWCRMHPMQHVPLFKSAEDANTYYINDVQDPLQRSLASLDLKDILIGAPPLDSSATFAPPRGTPGSMGMLNSDGAGGGGADTGVMGGVACGLAALSRGEWRGLSQSLGDALSRMLQVRMPAVSRTTQALCVHSGVWRGPGEAKRGACLPPCSPCAHHASQHPWGLAGALWCLLPMRVRACVRANAVRRACAVPQPRGWARWMRWTRPPWTWSCVRGRPASTPMTMQTQTQMPGGLCPLQTAPAPVAEAPA